jgi:hypothetical protein
MMRSRTAREYGYDESQRNSQDYDLWLRLVSDGRRIAKIDEELVYLRVHGDSITSRANRGNALPKVIRCKALHLMARVRGFSVNLYSTRWARLLSMDSLPTIHRCFRSARAVLLVTGECSPRSS